MIAARTQGFALIEALVAALLLSIGVLGIVGLQVATVKDYRDSRIRQYATVVATDLVDRIRANRAGTASYTTENLAIAESKDCAADMAAPCADAAHVALDDLHRWKSTLTALGFSSARTLINVDTSGSVTFVTVRVGWESRSGVTDVSFRTGIQ